jgi:predicted ArsR family transcriptional regulator
MPAAFLDLTPPRRRVLAALRAGARTVNDLAAGLGVTDNAVRGHLAALERGGLVRASGAVRTGVAGKPAVEYEATLRADVALSRAYAPALEALVAILAARLSGPALHAAFRDAGRRLATPARRPASLTACAATVRSVLTELGGAVRVTRARSHVDIQAEGCPLATAVAHVPATCTIVESMLETQTGRPVQQRCAHGARPSCAFRISA